MMHAIVDGVREEAYPGANAARCDPPGEARQYILDYLSGEGFV